MKKILISVLLIVLFWCGVIFFVNRDFDAEKILAQSIFKERTFSGKVQEVVTPKGNIRAYLLEEHSLPLVAMSFGFDKSGKAYETKVGAALLAESSLLDGAGDYSRKELRDVMKEKGIKIGVSVGSDRLSFSLSYVKEFEKDAIEVLKAVMYRPQLNAEDLDLARRQLAAARRQRAENPSYHLNKLVDEHFFGEHPYGREDIPDEQTLAGITDEDIRAYLKAAMGQENLKVGISGDITEAETALLLEDIFGQLPEKATLPDLPAWKPNFDADKVSDEFLSSAQSLVSLSAQGIKRLDKDFYPLYIANYVFGGSGLSSRLNKAVREEQGLTYGIYSYFTNSDAVDVWQVYFSATPEKSEKALDIAQKEYLKFYQEGISGQELQQAKKALLSSFNLRFSSLFNIADMLEQMQVQHLGRDFLLNRQQQVRAVSLEQTNRAIREKMPKSLDRAGKVRLFEIIGAKK